MGRDSLKGVTWDWTLPLTITSYTIVVCENLAMCVRMHTSTDIGATTDDCVWAITLSQENRLISVASLGSSLPRGAEHCLRAQLAVLNCRGGFPVCWSGVTGPIHRDTSTESQVGGRQEDFQLKGLPPTLCRTAEAASAGSHGLWRGGRLSMKGSPLQQGLLVQGLQSSQRDSGRSCLSLFLPADELIIRTE